MDSSNLWLYLLVAGVIVIAGLAYYAGKLLSQLKQQKIAQAEAELAIIAGQNAHDAKILTSVQIIAKAMKEEQCEYAEGCWRISVLLDSLKTSQALTEQFPAIFELYNQIKHMQILDARKDLAKKERMKQDVDRMKAEASLYDAINSDLNLLLQYCQERLSVLKQA